MGVYHDTLTFASARLRRLGFGVVAFFNRFTDLKAEKNRHLCVFLA
jgi:hypothetical protein